MDNRVNLTLEGNQFPDISMYLNNGNPTLRSPNSAYELSFMQTRESMIDVDLYSRFVHNAVNLFRGLRVYKNYKAYLMELGLDHCQYLHNISSDMATIEMNHCILTIFDVAVMITEHYLNTYGCVTVPHVVAALREEHTSNRIPLVMMSKTVHQLYHNADNFFTHPSQVFGKWVELLNRYQRGITPEICIKLLHYIRTAYEEEESTDDGLLQCAETIKNWSENIYGSYINTTYNSSPCSF